MIHKLCSCCRILKPLTGFYANKKCAHGVSYECKECVKERVVRWQKQNPEKHQAKKKRYYETEKGRAARQKSATSAAAKASDKKYSTTEKGRVSRKRLQKKYCAELWDPYIKTALRARGFHAEQITEDLIVAERKQLQLRRLGKKIKEQIQEQA